MKKMYNSVPLKEEHWCFQRYVRQNDLDITKLRDEKVIKTLIYGVISSVNQSERENCVKQQGHRLMNVQK